MAFAKKTWKDRVAEYINRRTLVKEDGTTELVTVERSEGTISQEGDAFSAANMNDLEQRIANEFDEQNKKIAELESNLRSTVTTDSGTVTGTIVGADKEPSTSRIVTFKEAFVTIPTITVAITKAIYSGNGSNHMKYASYTVSEITHTSFKLTIKNSNNQYGFDWTVQWQAEASILA